MNIIDRASEIAAIIKTYNDLDLYRKIVELEGQIIEITRTSRKQAERVEELESKLHDRGSMRFVQEIGWYVKEGDRVPFCPHCWEGNEKVVHLADFTDTIKQCPVCETALVNRNGKWHLARHI